MASAIEREARERRRKEHPYRPCGQCLDGMVLFRDADGERYARRCDCWLAWKRQWAPAPADGEGKAAAAGRDA